MRSGVSDGLDVFDSHRNLALPIRNMHSDVPGVSAQPGAHARAPSMHEAEKDWPTKTGRFPARHPSLIGP